jgi:hypothetical protein
MAKICEVKSAAKKTAKLKSALVHESLTFQTLWYSLTDAERNKLYNENGDVRVALEV